MSVTDTDKTKDRVSNPSPVNSRNTAGCAKCGRALARDEPLYITWGCAGRGGAPGHVPLCEGCTLPYMVARRHPIFSLNIVGRPCETCGRDVVFSADDVEHRYRKHVFCCERCRWTYYNTARNQRTAQARQKVCEVCGEEFTAKRRDAKTCSPACKQKAYRQRRSKHHI